MHLTHRVVGDDMEMDNDFGIVLLPPTYLGAQYIIVGIGKEGKELGLDEEEFPSEVVEVDVVPPLALTPPPSLLLPVYFELE